MKYKILFIIALVIGQILSGCGRNNNAASNTVTVTIIPIKTLVQEIVGDDFDIYVLVPSGAGPETYEPTPQQIKSLSDSKFLFSTGLLDFETELTAKLKNASSTKYIDLSDGIEIIEGNCAHSGSHSHAHGVDPHIWTSPKKLMIMAKNIHTAISSAYPDSVKYTENYLRLLERLDHADSTVMEILSEKNLDYFVIYHPALTYYSKDYGVEQISIEDEGKEPSAEMVRKIVDMGKRDGLHYILYQQQFSSRVVETIGRDIGAELIEYDPLAEDVIGNIIEVTKVIASNGKKTGIH